MDGISKYLLETKKVVDPRNVMERWSQREWNFDTYSSGNIRAFSSKMPTLCPQCNSYTYYKTRIVQNSENNHSESSEGNETDSYNKKCTNCNNIFNNPSNISENQWKNVTHSNQNAFKKSQCEILVATKGFGMGIDKGSVRFVVHASMPSGIEAWYQEVGRAGRDNERAHIVLMIDPPNDSCINEMKSKHEIWMPNCSFLHGCRHNREFLCDYGKQHSFIKNSYPGVVSDAKFILKVLDKLMTIKIQSNCKVIELRTKESEMGRTELSIYRLMVLGLVKDYSVFYRNMNAFFEVEMIYYNITDDPLFLNHLIHYIASCICKSIPEICGENIIEKYKHVVENYKRLQEDAVFYEKLQSKNQYSKLYNIVYGHLLIILDVFVYNNILKMKYDMLRSLLGIAEKYRCRRFHILNYFNERTEENYKCECCDICVPTLKFPEIRTQPKLTISNLEIEKEFHQILYDGIFDLPRLFKVKNNFLDYPSSTYIQARSFIEGSPNNLPALFFIREFSPDDEYTANAKRFLRTANHQGLSLSDVQQIYKTARDSSKPELLVLLNDAGTPFDTHEGWRFILAESAKYAQHGDSRMTEMMECLEFMLTVDTELKDMADLFQHNAQIIEDAFNA